MIITPKMARISLFSFKKVKKEILCKHDGQRTTDDNERRLIAIGYLSDSGELKISANLFYIRIILKDHADISFT